MGDDTNPQTFPGAGDRARLGPGLPRGGSPQELPQVRPRGQRDPAPHRPLARPAARSAGGPGAGIGGGGRAKEPRRPQGSPPGQHGRARPRYHGDGPAERFTGRTGRERARTARGRPRRAPPLAVPAASPAPQRCVPRRRRSAGPVLLTSRVAGDGPAAGNCKPR